MLFDQVLADDQSQTGTRFPLGTDPARIDIQPEKVFNQVFFHPDSIILNRNPDKMIGSRFRRNRNPPPFITELHRIIG